MRVLLALAAAVVLAAPSGAQRHVHYGPTFVYDEDVADGYAWEAPAVVRRLSAAERAQLARHTAERDRLDEQIGRLDGDIGAVLGAIDRHRFDRPEDPVLAANLDAFEANVADYLAAGAWLQQEYRRLRWRGGSARERHVYLDRRERLAVWGVHLIAEAARLQAGTQRLAHARHARADHVRVLTERGQALHERRMALANRRYIEEARRRHILFFHGR